MIEVILGLVLMSYLAASMDVLRVIVGIYFLYRGLSVLSFRGLARGNWWVILGALLVLLFSILVLVNPAFGTMSVVIWIGMAFLVTGMLNVMLGMRMKHVAYRLP